MDSNDDTANQHEPLRFEGEPPVRWTGKALDELLVWMVERKGSDIKLDPGQPVWMRLHGEWLPVTRRDLNNSEIAALLDETSRDRSASSRVGSGDDLDFAHEVAIDRTQRLRYRVNATGCSDGWASGMELTFRAIPAHPPTIQELGLEREIIEAAVEQPGLVLVAGRTGSGKSTLLAALLRYVNESYPMSIATFEDPIEFRLTGLKQRKGPVAQSQIGIHFDKFVRATRNSTRRAEDVILLGESRDLETVKQMIELADTGPRIYSTIHTQSAAETPGRIIRMFPSGEQNKIASDLMQCLRLIVYQQLMGIVDPETGRNIGRVAVREYLPITRSLRRQLEQARLSEYGRIIEQAMADGLGRDLLTHAAQLHAQGHINDEQLHQLRRARGAHGEVADVA